MTANPIKTSETRVEDKGVAHRHEDDHPLLALRQEVDQLFDNFFSGFTLGPFGQRQPGAPSVGRGESLLSTFGSRWSERFPKMDVSETDDMLKASIEVPGMDEKDVSLTIDGNILTVKGERKEERKEEKENYSLNERHYGAIERSFRLPDTADQDKIEAVLKKGILSLTVPKTATPEKTTRKVEIKKG